MKRQKNNQRYYLENVKAVDQNKDITISISTTII